MNSVILKFLKYTIFITLFITRFMFRFQIDSNYKNAKFENKKSSKLVKLNLKLKRSNILNNFFFYNFITIHNLQLSFFASSL